MLQVEPEIVYIEHCKFCNNHGWCTNHNEEKYNEYFMLCRNSILRECGNVKVSENQIPPEMASKFHTELTVSKPGKMHFPRIGSFEVYFRGNVIFSKIVKMKWPNPAKIVETIKKVQAEQDLVKSISVKLKKIKPVLRIKKKLLTRTKPYPGTHRDTSDRDSSVQNRVLSSRVVDLDEAQSLMQSKSKKIRPKTGRKKKILITRMKKIKTPIKLQKDSSSKLKKTQKILEQTDSLKILNQEAGFKGKMKKSNDPSVNHEQYKIDDKLLYMHAQAHAKSFPQLIINQSSEKFAEYEYETNLNTQPSVEFIPKTPPNLSAARFSHNSSRTSQNAIKIQSGSSQDYTYSVPDEDSESEEPGHPLRPVNRSYKIQLPVGLSNKKKITYQNSSEKSALFQIKSSHPKAMALKDSELLIEKGVKEKIQIIFSPVYSRDEKRYYLYLDLNSEPWECIEIIAVYE